VDPELGHTGFERRQLEAKDLGGPSTCRRCASRFEHPEVALLLHRRIILEDCGCSEGCIVN
jgi:hypothetical protein